MPPVRNKRKALGGQLELNLSNGIGEPQHHMPSSWGDQAGDTRGPVIKETEVDSDGQEISELTTMRNSQG